MRALIALALMTLPAPALAQSRVEPRAAVGDQHRWAMEQLRARADANEALARQQRLEARLTVLELQAARQAAPIVKVPDWRPLRSPEEERAARESATVRRQETVRSVTQIDAWLDRRPQ